MVVGLRASAFISILFLVACGGVTGNKNGNNDQSPADLKSSIQHVVIMVQENRSFDNYFGKLNDYRAARGLPADVDGLPSDAANPNFENTGDSTAFHLLTMCTENSSPSWNESHVDFNRTDPTSSTGLMNGFVYTAATFAQRNGLYDTEGRRVMGYYDQSDLPYYYFLATQFATSDRWFSPVPANSPANHFYLFAGTSAGHVYTPSSPFSIPTIFHLLEQKGISWKIYETDAGVTFLSYFQPFATQHQANLVPLSQFATDVANNSLPAVALIEAGLETGEDEHPGTNIQKGAADVAQVLDALMNSASWKNSVFIITWDEDGGLYDHVPYATTVSPDGIAPLDLQPNDIKGDFTLTGGRVPLLVISPFTKPHYVSHTPADYSAITKFIETRFDLPSLTKRDAAQPDMTEFFDWSAPNLNPPKPPTQPTTGPCYYDHLP